ncbi:hypothetical protein MPSI1_002716 [Malassezia psittaci]|uniref:General transcription and DNA repair factor IIH n=1 Tax=Malassezia psittaci TaxID=1821823 RepID=A0AAF0FD60_9BASI|nr:hypothetical protein MPSI1_002716 [Malassezia psittaci]
MRRREEDYVDGAELDDSDEAIEEHSDDSNEYEELPHLPSAPLRSILAERSASKRKRNPDPSAQSKSAKSAQRSLASGGYSWEAAYQRSWDRVYEDESGNLESAVRRLLASNKRKRALRDATPVQRGIIRHFVLVLDLSAEMAEKDLRPNRFELTLQYVKRFITDYFDQNPIGQLAIVATRDGLGERLSLMGGNTVNHSGVLSNKRKLEPRGEPSIQNALEMARSCLVHLPNSNTREILYISASLTSVDPGNIFHTIQQLVQDRIQVSVIALAAEMHVLREMADKTGGDFNVVMDEDHYQELLQKHVPPRIISEQPTHNEYDADLLVMGFPRRLPFNAPASLCACHGRVLSGDKTRSHLEGGSAASGYTCPRCYAKVCQVPTDCPVCGITVIMSTHLARSYHHLFPVANYQPVQWESVTNASNAACFSCAVPFPPKPTTLPSKTDSEESTLAPSSRYRCLNCKQEFCLECDAFVQEQLHTCPGCT